MALCSFALIEVIVNTSAVRKQFLLGIFTSAPAVKQSLLPVTMTNCYFPSGEFNGTLRPCGAESAQGRHCCFEGDYCLSNLLCLNTDKIETYRGGCTLQAWDANVCGDVCLIWPVSHATAHRCLNETDGSGQQLYSCDRGGCGTSSDMFAVGDAEIQVNGHLTGAINLQAEMTATIEATATTITGSCASTANASPGAEGVPSDTEGGTQTCTSAGVSTGGAIGIGLGTSLPLLIALAVMSWLFLRERRRAQYESKTGVDPSSTGSWGTGHHKNQGISTQEQKPVFSELLPNQKTPSELAASAMRTPMSADTRTYFNSPGR